MTFRIPARRRIASALLLGVAALPASAELRKVPYWVSLSASEALMRTGPAKTYPATWRYLRSDLPLRVVQVNGDWRRVEDPAGTTGWVKASLLSEHRTAIVTGAVRQLRAAPDAGARVNWRVQPGVVGRIAHCSGGWCEFEVKGRAGYIPTSQIWGTAPDEEVR